jgi:SPP1 gp7 family putative phage head morphogenesis protein
MATAKRKQGTTVNAKLQDQAIKHALFLERYKTLVSEEAVSFLNADVFPDLLARLEARLQSIRQRGVDTGWETTQRYKQFLTDLQDLLDEGSVELRKRTAKVLRELATIEAKWQLRTVRELVPKDAVAAVVPDKRLNLTTVQAVVQQPIQGRVLGDWVQDLADSTRKRVERQVGIGLASGETVDQIVTRVRGTKAASYRDGVLDATRIEAQAVVRTAAAHVSTQARVATYEAMADVIEGVQWVATLDTSTCKICGPLDGQVFEIKKLPPQPAHFNCRCTTVPVLMSIDKIGQRKKVGEVSDETRSAMDGDVPASVTYDEWIKSQPAEVQDEVFGRGRAKLYREGKISTRDMVTRTGRTKTLDELRK